MRKLSQLGLGIHLTLFSEASSSPDHPSIQSLNLALVSAMFSSSPYSGNSETSAGRTIRAVMMNCLSIELNVSLHRKKLIFSSPARRVRLRKKEPFVGIVQNKRFSPGSIHKSRLGELGEEKVLKNFDI